MTMLEDFADDPPQEDSEDLSDEEIHGAVPTCSASELGKHLIEELRRSEGLAVKGHELRRRGEDLFWRTRLVRAEEPERVLIFRVDWLGGG